MPSKRPQEPGSNSPVAAFTIRTTQACDRCRERKAKCGGQQPSCDRCLARGAICQYTPKSARRPSRPRLRVTPSVDIKRELEHHQPARLYSLPGDSRRDSIVSSTCSNDTSDRSLQSDDLPPHRTPHLFGNGRVSARTTSIVEIEAEILPPSMIPAAPSPQFTFPPGVVEAVARQRLLPPRLNLSTSHFNQSPPTNQPEQFQGYPNQGFPAAPLRHSASMPLLPPIVRPRPPYSPQVLPQPASYDQSFHPTTLSPAQFPTLSTGMADVGLSRGRYPRDLALESSLAAYQFPPPTTGDEYGVSNGHSPESDSNSTGSIGTSSWDNADSSAYGYQSLPPPVTPQMVGIQMSPQSDPRHGQAPFRALGRSTRSLTAESPVRHNQLTMERNAVWENMPISAPATQLYHPQSYQLPSVSMDTIPPHSVGEQAPSAFFQPPLYSNIGVVSSSPSSSSLAGALDFNAVSHTPSRPPMQYHQPPFTVRERAATFDGSTRPFLNQW